MREVLITFLLKKAAQGRPVVLSATAALVLAELLRSDG
jgi:hypothetical protein